MNKVELIYLYLDFGSHFCVKKESKPLIYMITLIHLFY